MLVYDGTDQRVTLETEPAHKSLALIPYAIEEGPDEPVQIFSLASNIQSTVKPM